ncbi:hypothetical protein [Autumnicola edwardsiae]|uniref:DUF304 domain-containing protein n=1 Tax=Autumnicola edwardsiae TaxID=3075594 RepID=A0ABU3CVD1_9FLAO|nr:hypothetical protein [Zunongwangia sp. F297]MDT0650309.1 hypothetical protein [Zunongwangia sp. F297]
MNKIEKPYNFFRKNYHYIFGGFWIFVGVVSIFLHESMPFFLYVPLGILYAGYAYYYGNRTEEYIAWNKEKVVIKERDKLPLEYNYEEIDSLKIFNNHFTIKSGAANGIILELKGYKAEDIAKLEKALLSVNHNSLNISS